VHDVILSSEELAYNF